MIAIEDSGHTDMEHGLKAAALVRLKAAELCPGDVGGCFPHHGIRPYLRLFGMVGGPGRNEAFFMDALTAAARDKPDPRRILISGSADDSMYALARRAVPAGAITLLDRCGLPLYLCRRLADRNAEPIETIACDIFDYASQGNFHIVCSDAFFCQIPLSRHAALMDIWRRALSPDGQVITTTRIDPNSPDEGLARSPAQIAAFRDRVLENARPWRHAIDLSLDEIADLAERHASLIRLHNPRSREELTDLFESGGFRIDRLNLTEQSRSARAVSDQDRIAFYAEIVATRL